MSTATSQKPAALKLSRYLYHIDGLGRQVWSKYSPSEKVAHAQVWNDLTEGEKNHVSDLDWIDTQDAPTEPAINWREHRFTSPDFVRCPAKCDSAIGCPQCSFWGTVPKGSADAECTHVLRKIGTIARCLTSHQCSKCGAIITIDSSD